MLRTSVGNMDSPSIYSSLRSYQAQLRTHKLLSYGGRQIKYFCQLAPAGIRIGFRMLIACQTFKNILV